MSAEAVGARLLADVEEVGRDDVSSIDQKHFVSPIYVSTLES